MGSAKPHARPVVGSFGEPDQSVHDIALLPVDHGNGATMQRRVWTFLASTVIAAMAIAAPASRAQADGDDGDDGGRNRHK